MSEADAILDRVRSANADGAQALACHDVGAAGRAFTTAVEHLRDLDDTDVAIGTLAAAAHIGLGRVGLAVDDVRAADLRFDQAQRLRPTNPDGFYWAGCAAAHDANYPRAEWLFNATIELDGCYGRAYLQRAYVRLRLLRADLALPDLLAAHRHQVADDDVRLLTAALLAWQGDAEEATGIAADVPDAPATSIRNVARYRRRRLDREHALLHRVDVIAAARRGDWSMAADVLPDDVDGPADDLVLLKAVACVLSGRRADAADHLTRAVALSPADHRINHAQAVLRLHTLSATEVRSPDWRGCIGAWVSVLHDEDFWTRWRGQAEPRCGCPVPEDTISAARTALYELVERRLPSDDLALLLRRERAAAALLARVGGLPDPDPTRRPLVCGPLRIAELGLQQRLSDFLRGLPATDDDIVALLRQFSGIGLAVAQLAADRPEAAALAALDLRCPSCARAGGRIDPAMISEPLLCEPGCLQFDYLNPAFSGYPDKYEELTRVSAALATETLLGIARGDITAATMDLADAKRCWRAAVTLAMRFNRREAALREIADDALGRALVLSKRDDHTGAIDVLDAALAAIPSKDATEHDRVTYKLAVLLNVRAVSVFEEDGEQALADLIRAVRYHPDLPLLRFNLGRLLNEMSYQALQAFNTVKAIRLLSDAVYQFDTGAKTHGTKKFLDELERARQALADLLGEYPDPASDTES